MGFTMPSMTSQKTLPPDHRTDRIPIRVTPRQKAVLVEAAGLSALDVSSWLRALGMERAAVLGVTEATVTVPEDSEPMAKGVKVEGPMAAPAPAHKGKAPARPKG